VERLLSFRQTCRLRKQPTFPLLADAVKAYFKEQTPNLSWLA
jgi:transposase